MATQKFALYLSLHFDVNQSESVRNCFEVFDIDDLLLASGEVIEVEDASAVALHEPRDLKPSTYTNACHLRADIEIGLPAEARFCIPVLVEFNCVGNQQANAGNHH